MYERQRMLPPQKEGDFIPVRSVLGANGSFPGSSPDNTINGSGMSGLRDRNDTHDNNASGKTMWLASCRAGERAWIAYDFGATYPVGEMLIWNYNQCHRSYEGLYRRGMKDVKIEHSLDGEYWSELRGQGYPYRFDCADGSAEQKASASIRFGGMQARYVKITAEEEPGRGNWGGYDGQERLFGLSQVRFYAGAGIAAEPDEAWTNLFHRSSGWTGADGIYAIPFNGSERQAAAADTKTLFVFGDTFIGEVDLATDRRLHSVMINNSLAVLKGAEPKPEAITFHWRISPEEGPLSSIVPATPRGLANPGAYYWLQDGASVGGKFYCFPLVIVPDLGGPEGFQFAVEGVTRVSAPWGPEGPAWQEQTQVDTPLYYIAANGCTTYFGAALMPNTEEAGVPAPDGYIYIYGIQSGKPPKPVSARVPAEFFEDFERWTYWDGKGWSAAKENAVPFGEEISCEYSVSMMTGGPLDGQYIAIYQEPVSGRMLSMYVGDSPVGPFGPPVRLFACESVHRDSIVYNYNAKAHPHLSQPGELLTSYNVNTTSWDAHALHAGIYRPRFIRLRQILPAENDR